MWPTVALHQVDSHCHGYVYYLRYRRGYQCVESGMGPYTLVLEDLRSVNILLPVLYILRSLA